MATFKDRVVSSIEVEGQQALNELGKLEMEYREIQQAMKGLKKETKEYIQITKEIGKVERRMERVRLQMELLAKEGKTNTKQYEKLEQQYASAFTQLNTLKQKQQEVTRENQEYVKQAQKLEEVERKYKKVAKSADVNALSVRQLKDLQRRLRDELESLPRSAEGYDVVKKKLQQVSGALGRQRAELNDTRTRWQKLKASISEFKAIALGNIVGELTIGAMQSLGQAFTQAIDGAKELDDSFSDIQKKTGLTRQEVEGLVKELGKIDTRTSSADLRQMAVIAGSLGIPKEEIRGFVEQVDRAVVALGDEFTGGAEEASRSLGRIKTLFEDTRDLKAGDAVNRIGSAINALGNAGSALAPEMVEFTQRMGQLGDLAPTVGESLGFAAALTGELGFRADTAAGGLSNLFLVAGQNASKFAQVMGMTTAEFENLLNHSPNEMILQLAERLQGASNTDLSQTLKDLGVGSQESVKVLGALSSNLDFVREKQALASAEFQKATSLLEEFNIKNTSLAGRIAKAQKSINGFKNALIQGLAPAIVNMLEGFAKFLGLLRELPGFLERNRGTIIRLGVALVALNLPMIAAQFAILRTNVIAWVASSRVAALSTLSFKTAFQALNAAMRANPIGVIITALMLLGEGLAYAYRESETFRNTLNGLMNVVKEFWEITKDAFGAFQKIVSGDVAEGLRELDRLVDGNNFKNAGKRLADAFSEGYKEEATQKAKERAKAESDAYFAKLAEETLKQKKKGAGVSAPVAGALPAAGGTEAPKETEEERAAREKYERLLKEYERYKEELARMEKERRLSAMSEPEREIEEVRLKYARLQEENQRFLEQEIIDQQEHLNRSLNLDKQFRAEKKKLEEARKAEEEAKKAEVEAKIEQEFESEMERELRQEAQRYNALIEQAEKYDLDTQKLEEARQAAMDAIRQKWADKEKKDQEQKHIELEEGLQNFYGGFTSLMNETANLIGGNSAALLGFQKIATLTQVAIDTASAMSAAIAGATQAAAATGPGAPFALAGYIASMIGTVVGAFGQVKNMISSAKEPTPPKFQHGGGFNTDAGLVKGASHAQGGIKMIDSNTGKVVGEMEGDEPYFMLSSNIYKNHKPLIDQMLYNSMYRNGAPIVPDVEAMTQVVKYEVGGIFNAQAGSTASEVENTQGQEMTMMLLQEIRGLRGDMTNWNTRLQAFVTYEHLDTVMGDGREAEQDAAF